MRRALRSSSKTPSVSGDGKAAELRQRAAEVHKFGESWKEEIAEIAREALAMPVQSQVHSVLNDLLFCRTMKANGLVMKGLDGLAKLKSENRQERCGKLFKEGDLAYNCRTCQVDNTCVICQDCFSGSDHTGHEVTFHRTSPGGCCDCGDEEAWNPRGFCSQHGKQTSEQNQGDADPRTSLPENVAAHCTILSEVIYATLAEALTEVFKSYVRGMNGNPDVLDDFATIQKSGAKAISLVTNNDDVHGFDEVESAFRTIAVSLQIHELTTPQIQTKVAMIDQQGRGSVFVKSFYSEDSLKAIMMDLVVHARTILEDQSKLLVCVSFDSQLELERKAIAGISWMTEIANASLGLGNVIIDLLVSEDPRFSVRSVFAERFMKKKCQTNPFWPSDPEESMDNLPIVTAALNYDCMMPKQLLKVVQSLWLSLLTNISFKHYLGNRFMDAHHRLACSFSCGLCTANESSLMFAVHLLTVPSIVKLLEQKYEQNGDDNLITNTLHSVKALLWTCYCKGTHKIKGSMVTLAKLDLGDPNIYNHRYQHFLVHVRYIFRLASRPLIDKPNKVGTGRQEALLGIIKFGQRIDPHSRHQGPYHVDRETEDWVRAFNMSMSLNQIVRQGALLLANDTVAIFCENQLDLSLSPRNFLSRFSEMCYSFSLVWFEGEKVTVKSLGGRHGTVEQQYAENSKCLLKFAENEPDLISAADKIQFPRKEVKAPWGETYELVDANIHAGAFVSYHLPVQRFFVSTIFNLGVILETRPFSRDMNLADLLSDSMPDLDIIQLMEDPLRIIVSSAQIHCQLWRRNGYTMDNIVTNYKGLCSYFMYQADIAMLQIAASIRPAELILASLLHKFELLEFFTEWNIAIHPHDPQLADELLRVLIHMIVEIPVTKTHGRSALRREIIHAIATADGPVTFSMISERVRIAHITYSGEHDVIDDQMEDDDENDIGGVAFAEIEKLVDEVAIRNGSSGTSFTYSLRPETWDEIDPYFWNVPRQQEEAVADKLFREKKRSKSKRWPMAAPPPGPPCRIVQKARDMILCPTLLSTIVENVFFNALIAGTSKIVGEKDGHVFKISPEMKESATKKGSPGLLHTTLHLFTIFTHVVRERKGEGQDLASVDEMMRKRGTVHEAMRGTNPPDGFSLLELLANLELMFVQEHMEEKVVFMDWCNSVLEAFYPELSTLRGALGLGKKKQTKTSKSSTKKKARAHEAQKLAMERMKKAQERASQALGVEADDDDFCHEENFCVLCHEKLTLQQYAFLGFARNSAWGNPLPLLPEEKCPPEVLSISRKPAGWKPAADGGRERSSSGAANANELDWSLTQTQEEHGVEGVADLGVMDDDDLMEDDLDLDLDEVGIAGGAQFDLVTAGLHEFISVGDVLPDGERSLPRSSNEEKSNSNPAEVVQATESQVYISFCSHAMHLECIGSYLELLRRDAPGHPRIQVPDIRKHEFLCPMCKSMSNIVVPHSLNAAGSSSSSVSAEGSASDEGAGISDKRRRISPSTPDDMTFFIRGQLNDVESVSAPDMRASSDIQQVVDNIHAIASNSTRTFSRTDVRPPTRQAHRAGLRAGATGAIFRGGFHRPPPEPEVVVTALQEEKLVKLWNAIGFSIRARASMQMAHCGSKPSGNSIRDLRELLEPTKKQWFALFRSCQTLSLEYFTAGSELSEPTGQTDSPNRFGSSFYSRIGEFAASSSSPGAFAKKLSRSLSASSQATSATSGVLSSSSSSSSPAAAPGVSSQAQSSSSPQNREPLSFLAKFLGLRKGNNNKDSKPGEITSSNASASVAQGSRSESSKLNDFGEQVESRVPFFEMISTGQVRSKQSKITSLLSPGLESSWTLPTDGDILSASAAKTEDVPVVIVSDTVVKDSEGVNFLIKAGDKVFSMPEGQMKVVRKVFPDGVLLNMLDPVVVLTALLSALPQSMHFSAARTVAVATLVQGLVRPSQIQLCGSSMESSRMDLVQRWIFPLREISPEISMEKVYYVLFVVLSRFLRSAVLLLEIPSAETNGRSASDSIDQLTEAGRHDEVEMLWHDFLGLPPIETLVESDMMQVIRTWIEAYPQPPRLSFDRCCLSKTCFGLISLPEHYEQLMTLVSRNAKCPTTGKPIRNPVLCLRCGVVLCGASRLARCCTNWGNTQESTMIAHTRACGGGSGVFLHVQKCIVSLVHGIYFTEKSAPYVDSYGEADDHLRRGRPLRFHETAYRNLHYLCLNNEIAQQVLYSPRLEINILNNLFR